MLDAFAVVDASIAQALAAAAPARAACRAGCVACCRQAVIPITPLERETLRFWVKEKLTPSLKGRVNKALVHSSTVAVPDCPFLIAGACAVYPVRPIACRRFMVLGSSCGPEEDCLQTRPHDVLQPSREALYTALARTAPFYERVGLLAQGQSPDFAFFTRICLNLKQLPLEQDPRM